MNKFLTFTLAGMAFFASCNNEDSFLEHNVPLQTKAPVACTETQRFYVEDGIIHFSTLEDAIFVTDSVVNLSDTEYHRWAESIGLRSYRSHIAELMDAAYQLESEQEFDAFVQLNSQYLLQKDEEIYPRIDIRFYTSICNTEGVYYIGDVKTVVDEQYVTTYQQNTVINQTPYKFETKTRTVGETNYAEKKAYFDDRAVFTSAKVYLQTLYENTNSSRYQLAVQVYMNAKKKGAVRWKHYKTIFYIREVLIQVDNTPVWNSPENTPTDIQFGMATYKNNLEVSSGSELDVWYYDMPVGASWNCAFNVNPAHYMEYKAYTRGTGYNNYILYKVIEGVLQ